MKNIYTLSIIIIVAIMMSNTIYARGFRVMQIPNGSAFRCANCHISSGGGGALTPFGLDVKKSLNGDDVNWNDKLAKLDSDGDGYTNGEELLDPNGTWRQGDLDPGEANNVGNPGDPKSKPKITIVEELNNNKMSISPNPVSNYSVFSIFLNKSENLVIDLINLNGVVVNRIYNGFAEKGEFSMQWYPIDKYGNKLNPSLYLLRIRYNHEIIVRRVIIL